MGLSDPFSTTYQGSLAAGESLGQGIQSAAGSVADVMKQKQKLVEDSKQRSQAFGMLKNMGLIQEDTTLPSLDDLKTGLKVAGKTMGKDISFEGHDGMDESTQRNWLGSLYKSFNIPMPQGKTKTTISPGVGFDLGGGVSYTGQKPIDPMVQEMKNERMDMEKQRIKDQEEKNNTQEWDKLDKVVNPNIATNRSPLGMAGRANMSADRAITTLKQSDVTNQEAGNVMADIASIYQAGSPTEFGMSEQGYRSIQAQISGLQQYVTGKPTDALPPDIKERLKGVLQGMKNTNSKVIKQNLDYIERAHGNLINKDPDKWKDMRSILEGDLGDDSSNGATSTLKAAGMGGQSQKSGSDYQSYLKSIGQ